MLCEILEFSRLGNGWIVGDILGEVDGKMNREIVGMFLGDMHGEVDG